jgi:hypothetical protein
MPEDCDIQGDVMIFMEGVVIGVEGESSTDPGVARSFEYPKIDPTPPLVTLSVSYAGATEYAWEIVSQPVGASAVLSDETAPEPTFTPTASVPGSYLLKCTVNGGEAVFTNGLAFLTQHLSLRKPAPGETNQFSATRGWEAALGVVLDEVDALGSSIQDAKGARRRAVIDILDCTLEPPASSTGDRYILDTSGTAHVDYGATAGDIVEYMGSAWEAQTPSEGWVAYVDEKDVDYRFVNDGTPTWEEVTGGSVLPYPSSHIWVDQENGSDVTGDGTRALPFATLAAAAASFAAPSDFAEYSTPVVFHVGPGTYSDTVALPRRLKIAIIGSDTVITGAITRDYVKTDYGAEVPTDHLNVLSISATHGYGITLSDVTSKNSVAEGAAVNDRNIVIKDAVLLGHILNIKSGGGFAGSTGTMRLTLLRCSGVAAVSATKRIGGERDTGFMSPDNNQIQLVARNSTIYHRFYGCLEFMEVSSCFLLALYIDYSVNPVDASTGYAGCIGGGNTASGVEPDGVGFVDTEMSGGTIKFGWNGSTGEAPVALKFDSNSYKRLNDATSLSFNGANSVAWLTDYAAGIEVDNSGWSGNLGSEVTVQAALDTIDALSLGGGAVAAADVTVDNSGFGGNIDDAAASVQDVLDEFDRPAAERPWPGAFVNSMVKIDSVRGQAQDVFSCSIFGKVELTESVCYISPEGAVDGIFPVPRGCVVSAKVRIVAIRGGVEYGFPFIKVWDIDITAYNDEGFITLINFTTDVVCQTGGEVTNSWIISLDKSDVTESFSIRGYTGSSTKETGFQGSLRATMINMTHLEVGIV